VNVRTAGVIQGAHVIKEHIENLLLTKTLIYPSNNLIIMNKF